MIKFTFTDNKWKNHFPDKHERVNENDTWTKNIIFLDLLLNRINVIENSLTIQGFPWLFLKIFSMFSRFSMNPAAMMLSIKVIKMPTYGQGRQKIQKYWDKRDRRGPLQTKRAENFQGLEINLGKLLLVYFMRLFRPWSIGCNEVLGPWSLGEFAPGPSRQPCAN